MLNETDFDLIGMRVKTEDDVLATNRCLATRASDGTMLIKEGDHLLMTKGQIRKIVKRMKKNHALGKDL